MPKETRLTGVRNGVLEVRVAAPASEGKANEALVNYLSEAIRVPKRSVSITAGLRSRTKRVEVEGVDLDELHLRIEMLKGALNS